VTSVLIDAAFVASVVIIWFMLIYQFLLCMLGFLYSRRTARERTRLRSSAVELPRISLLIPAHNEAVVLDHTLAAMAALDYPRDRLEVLVINDASTDRTGEIASEWARRDSCFRVLDLHSSERAGGKSAALNRGLKACSYETVAVYDADNTPEPSALKDLALQLAIHPDLGAVIGTFRTVNRNRNLLTRMISIEGIGYQWMVQAGRWMLLRVCTLPGTNLLIRRSLLESLGGWDQEALTEDAELSIQIYEAGHKIKYVPYAVTWEQEPERLSTWFRQRSRWVRGNNYVLSKHLKRLIRIRPRRLGLELLYSMSLYYVFFAAILLSDLLFVLGALGALRIDVPGPYGEVWMLAFAMFVLELSLALSRVGEDSFFNIALAGLSYFTYCQLWIPVVCIGFYDDFVRRKARTWSKTERFEVNP
jgi:cellulose synthase/poly-beta-1,6-N-acetylglucosamine synthase-like glycosyltransferase